MQAVFDTGAPSHAPYMSADTSVDAHGVHGNSAGGALYWKINIEGSIESNQIFVHLSQLLCGCSAEKFARDCTNFVKVVGCNIELPHQFLVGPTVVIGAQLVVEKWHATFVYAAGGRQLLLQRREHYVDLRDVAL